MTIILTIMQIWSRISSKSLPRKEGSCLDGQHLSRHSWKPSAEHGFHRPCLWLVFDLLFK
jgi:hypothetical protein